MSIFLGIDVGSSSIKGGLLNLARKQVTDICQRPFPESAHGLPAAYFEVDAEAVVIAVREVLNALHQVAGHVDGIVVSSQMGGVILTDPAGNPLTRYLSWRDQRVMTPLSASTESVFSQLKDCCSPEDLAATGNELRPGASVCLLYWLARHNALPRQDAIAMNLGDFVVAKLCGAEPVTEPTMALSSLNLQTGDVHREWFSRLGFGQIQWPRITTVDTPAGWIKLADHSVPCYPAVGDHQCALLGAGLQENELSINVSTGSQVGLLTSSFTPGNYQTRPFFKQRWLNTITHLPAGRSLNALVDLLCELSTADGHSIREPWTTIIQLLDRIPETDLQVNLAFFAGSLGDRGQIANATLENLSAGHLFLAALKSMAENYAECATRLAPSADWNQVVLSGGLAQKIPRLRQILTTKFPGPMRSPNIVEETLEGLLQLALQIAANDTDTAMPFTEADP